MATPPPRPRVPPFIGLTGYAGVGKDAVRAVLCEQFDCDGAAFGDKLRNYALCLDNYLPELGKRYSEIVAELGYERAKREHPAVRDYLVRIAHGARELLSPNLWLDLVLAPPDMATAHAALLARTRPLVISDVRYPNEAHRIHELGGLVIRIERPGVQAANETERATLERVPFDHVLDNDGGRVETLGPKVTAVLTALARGERRSNPNGEWSPLAIAIIKEVRREFQTPVLQ